MTARTTIVIATHDRLPLLRESVGSVVAQTTRDWELVIVDDASSDGTYDWVSGLADERIRAIRLEEHSERSAARNRGLDDCRTPYVLFLDDDDLLVPDAIARLLPGLESDPECIAVVGGCVCFDDEGHEYSLPHPARTVKRDVWLESIFGWVGQIWRTLFRTEVVRTAGSFASGLVMGEDRDLWLRVSRFGPVLLIPDVVARYRVHSGQWRPAEAEALEQGITERALGKANGTDRRRGERALSFRKDFDSAYAALSDSRHRDALRSFAAIRRAPLDLVVSPITRGPIIRGIRRALTGAIIGRRGVLAVRSLRSRLRRAVPDEDWRVPAPKRIDLDRG